MDEHNSQIVQLKKKLKEYQEQIEHSEKKSARHEAEVVQLKESLKEQVKKMAPEHQITIEELKEKLKEYQKKERPDFMNWSGLLCGGWIDIAVGSISGRYKAFISSDGMETLVGNKDEDNDHLIFQVASARTFGYM